MNVDHEAGRRSLFDLYREEADTQARALSNGLLTLERVPTDQAALEACMRAAHSLKGAARIIDLQDGVVLANRMEECFVAAQRGELALAATHIDELLGGVDLLLRVAAADAQAAVSRDEIDAWIARLGACDTPDTTRPSSQEHPVIAPARSIPAQAPASETDGSQGQSRMLRVNADHLDKLLSLSGESLAETRWLKPFAESMLRAKRIQREAARALDVLHEALANRLDVTLRAALDDARRLLGSAQQMLSERIDELDGRDTNVAQQLYDEALQCRMRPFGDAAQAYPRIVRGFARSMGKSVRFTIEGEATQVDRDILDTLDTALGHLLRNALDHGVETPDVRRACGKPAEARVTLEARHSAGKLLISVSDDGAGIDPGKLRAAVIARGLADKATAARLSEEELLEFLLLPGFSMREHVTDVSGRGVGLDAVHEMAKAVRGTVRIYNDPGRGTRFVLQLPLTLSVLRSLIVDVGGEAYAFPLAQVRRTLELEPCDIDTLEGLQHFTFEGQPVGLVTAHQLLGGGETTASGTHVAVVLIGDERCTYGVAVNRFLGERMLVVQPLDGRLGKVKDIAAGALMDNGEAVLIIDVDDLLRSVERLVHSGRLDQLQSIDGTARRQRRHVLIIDDSLTVRELERKLLENRGYAVTVAVDGMDGLNALRSAHFDLVVTDVDMPRMDGIELVALMKRDAVLKALPVMIVSYKDREEDRRRGLEAGADYYLAKGSFHDEALLDAVRDLIGEA